MAKNMHKSYKGSIALNIFALVFTLLPLISLGVWTHHILFSDQRKVVELASVDSANSPRLFEEPLISITFDDGWESIYSEAAPIMSRYGIVSTQYILPSQFNRPIYMSAEQALSMKEAGHEISSHTYSHLKLTEVSKRQVDNEIDDSLKVLRKLNLLDVNNLTFAAPNGALGGYSLEKVKQEFVIARNVSGDLANDVSDNDMNTKANFDRYDIIGYSVGQYTTIGQLKEAIEYAKAHNAWFVPVYHQIDNSGSEYGVAPEIFDRHMKLFKDSGIKIVSMRDVVVNNQGVIL